MSAELRFVDLPAIAAHGGVIVGRSFIVNYSVQNNGSDAVGARHDRLSLMRDGAEVDAAWFAAPAVDPSGLYNAEVTMPAPTAAATHWVVVQLGQDVLPAALDDPVSITFDVVRHHIECRGAELLDRAAVDTAFQLYYTAVNVTDAPSPEAGHYDRVTITADDGREVHVQYPPVAQVGPQGGYSQTVEIPGQPAGRYMIRVHVDPEGGYSDSTGIEVTIPTP